MPRKALLINKSDTDKDPRPKRMKYWLVSDDYEVTNLSTSSSYSDKHSHKIENKLASKKGKLIFSFLLLTRQYEKLLDYFFVNINAEIRCDEYDVVVVSDLLFLPLALKIKSKKVVFDAREYYIRQFEDDLKWTFLIKPIYKYIHDNYIDKPDVLLTVSNTIVNEYKKYRSKPVVFFPSYASYNEGKFSIDKRFSSRKKLIHHGFCNKQRKIEYMIEFMDILGNEYQLDFYFNGFVGDDYQKSILNMVEKRSNIRILPPVDYDKLIELGSSYDFGLVIFPNDTTFNVRHSLSNKIFEMLQSRLPLVIGGVVEASYIFDKYNVGFHSPDLNLNLLAKNLKNINRQDYLKFIHNCEICAKELNLEAQRTEFLEILNDNN